VRAARPAGAGAPVIHFSPTGRRIDQALVRELAAGPGAVLLCGRYEGIDQRVSRPPCHDLELSLGDFVLSGGELPALALLDAHRAAAARRAVRRPLARAGQLLRRPAGLPALQPARTAGQGRRGVPVPPVLLSGHHADIARWRRERSLELTAPGAPT
jgi:tRNA (guanine37-N1)-methyltransferase